MQEIIIQFNNDGTALTVYNEVIDLDELGKQHITRASFVEPNSQGKWEADMSPIKSGCILGPFDKRSEALDAERDWLNKNLFV